MATRNPIQPQPVQQAAPAAAQLCDYCGLRPKFANHAYCSKTCGTQAATLCNHCHKKPKFQNFDYCGKACAALAAPTAVPKPAAAQRAPASGAVPNAGGAPRARGPQAATTQGQQQPLSLDPVQIAQLVIQQMPQVQSLLSGAGVPTSQSTSNPAPPAYTSTNPFANAPQSGGTHSGYPAHAQNANVNHATAYAPATNSGSGAVGGQQQYDDAEDLECLIPGCGKPVHVDAKGLKTSDYCSQRHREEAVTRGLVSACIMCLTKPQSRTDYFCSRTCREESLKKQYQANSVPGQAQPVNPLQAQQVQDDDLDEIPSVN